MFVSTNLVHQQLWTKVEEFQLGPYQFCKGVPPQKLHPEDQQIGVENVLVSHTEAEWTVAQWAEVFDLLQCDRVVMAMVTDDSTVVYYIVYRGLQVPRKN